MSQSKDKLSNKDATTAKLLKFAPWLAVPIASLPAPLVFLVLFLTSAATESAAVYLLLAGLSLVADLGFGLPQGTAVRTCLVASSLARRMDLGDSMRMKSEASLWAASPATRISSMSLV